MREQGSQPSFAVKTVTSISRTVAETHIPVEHLVEVIQIEREDKRPGGRRFGALVHAIFASIEFESAHDHLQAIATTQGRAFGAPPEEIEAAVSAVAGALRHPVLQRAARATRTGNIRRETPVLFTMADGTLAEGVLDLAFQEQESDFSGWTVVDFKTDQEFSVEASYYKRQVSLYVNAVQAATRLPTRGILLIV